MAQQKAARWLNLAVFVNAYGGAEGIWNWDYGECVLTVKGYLLFYNSCVSGVVDLIIIFSTLQDNKYFDVESALITVATYLGVFANSVDGVCSIEYC